MREPLRSRYLAALGIDNYAPRALLPGALPSAACEWDIEALEAPAPAAAPEGSSAAPAAPVERPRIDALATKDTSATRNAAPVPVETPARNAAQAAIPRFALSIVFAANGVLLIDDAPSAGAQRSEYERLLGNFLKAATHSEEFSLDVFFWPLRRNPQIAQDENAARETLSAHLQKQIQQRAIRTVLLLGDAAQRWVDIDAAALRSIRSISLLGCLREPASKRQLWNDVRDVSAG